jgi:hypothetical protein
MNWMRTIIHRPGYHSVYGEITKCASEASVFIVHCLQLM